jgi:hypothetical protein
MFIVLTQLKMRYAQYGYVFLLYITMPSFRASLIVSVKQKVRSRLWATHYTLTSALIPPDNRHIVKLKRRAKPVIYLFYLKF